MNANGPESQESQYAADGVIRVRGLLTPERLAEVRARITSYLRDVAPSLPANDVVFEADGQTVRNLWRMERHDRYFESLAAAPALLDLVGRLVHGKPVLMGVETFNKAARVGSKVPPHQDNAYFCQDPPDVLTVWIAIDAVTPENGPVFYVRGSHREGMLPHKPSGVSGNSMGLDAPFDASNPFVGTLDPGDALVHHCQTIHYSAPNTTDRARCALLMVFRGEHTVTSVTLKQAYTQQAVVAG